MTKKTKRKNPLAQALADADLERALECLQIAPAEAEWDTVVVTDALWEAIQQPLRLYRGDKEAWRRLAVTGMSQDFSWEASARRYLELYAEALADRRAGNLTAMA